MENVINPSLAPPLLTKPKPETSNLQFISLKSSGENTFCWRSYTPEDLLWMHDRAHRPYARKFWQLALGQEELREIYRKILANPRSHSFIGEWNGVPFCQLDMYGIIGSELQPFMQTMEDQDIGIHFIAAPPRQLKRGVSEMALISFAEYVFSLTPHARIFAEPDAANFPAHLLAERVGFQFQQKITLSDKQALLYKMSAKV